MKLMKWRLKELYRCWVCRHILVILEPEVEAGGLGIQVQFGLHSETHLKKQNQTKE
jgi:hypothetical protein